MARPLRIEFEGALYHVMARGNARQRIFLDDADCRAFIQNLGCVARRFHWRVWAWCLMDNHDHLLVETRQPTFSKGMREVSGVYTQAFNRCHRRVGHVLQGRYIVLDPLRAGLVASAADYARSSYRPVMGKASAPDWLAVDDTLAMFHP